MTSYEHDLARWARDARMNPKKPIETAITSLKEARKLLSKATLENRHDNLRDVGAVFDEATALLDPPMMPAILKTLQPICDGFNAALITYSKAVRQKRGLLMKSDQITQQELATFKHEAGGFIDKLIKWFESLPAA